MQIPQKWIRWLPGLLTLRDYRATWLTHDIVAGSLAAVILGVVVPLSGGDRVAPLPLRV